MLMFMNEAVLPLNCINIILLLWHNVSFLIIFCLCYVCMGMSLYCLTDYLGLADIVFLVLSLVNHLSVSRHHLAILIILLAPLLVPGSSVRLYYISLMFVYVSLSVLTDFDVFSFLDCFSLLISRGFYSGCRIAPIDFLLIYHNLLTYRLISIVSIILFDVDCFLCLLNDNFSILVSDFFPVYFFMDHITFCISIDLVLDNDLHVSFNVNVSCFDLVHIAFTISLLHFIYKDFTVFVFESVLCSLNS